MITRLGETCQVPRVVIERDDGREPEPPRLRVECGSVERIEGTPEERDAIELLRELSDRPGAGVAPVDERRHRRAMRERAADDRAPGQPGRQRRHVRVRAIPLRAVDEGHTGSNEQHASGRRVPQRVPEIIEPQPARHGGVAGPIDGVWPEREPLAG